MRSGVDTGGTFTDVVADDGRVAKVLSTRDDPARAVAAAVAELGRDPDVLAHGTTVATNALLERRGARVALVATRGFADVIEIARQVRPSLYDPFADRPAPLVPRDLRFEVGGRLDGRRSRARSRGTAPCPTIPDARRRGRGVPAARRPQSRRPSGRSRPRSRAAGVDVTASNEVSPEFREYERMVTTVVNAYLRPACASVPRTASRASPPRCS